MPKEYLIDELLTKMIQVKAEDLHISAGLPPTARISGALTPLQGFNILDKEEITYLISQLFNEEQISILYEKKELNSLYEMDEKSRFRVNAYFEKGNLATTIRRIAEHIPTLEELGMPQVLYEFCKMPQGLLLLTGASGMGKSSTAAAMINWINKNKSVHIVTIEDPIEFLFKSDKSLVHQREMYSDTLSWENALHSTLRENADVIFIGEIRDYKVMGLAIAAAESGHLVISTLHTYSSEQTIERVIGIFPELFQQQAKMQLSGVLVGTVTQTLLRTVDESKRIPAYEIMLSTQAVKNTIREGNTHFLTNIINTSGDLGMISMERSLAELVTSGKVNLEEALARTSNQNEVLRYMKSDQK